MQCIVAIGTFGEGFSFHGPFSAEDIAVEWAEKNAVGDWSVCPLVDTVESDTLAPVSDTNMIDMTRVRTIFREKLAATDSMDAALTKAVWIAFKFGVSVGEKNLDRACLYGQVDSEPSST